MSEPTEAAKPKRGPPFKPPHLRRRNQVPTTWNDPELEGLDRKRGAESRNGYLRGLVSEAPEPEAGS